MSRFGTPSLSERYQISNRDGLVLEKLCLGRRTRYRGPVAALLDLPSQWLPPGAGSDGLPPPTRTMAWHGMHALWHGIYSMVYSMLVWLYGFMAKLL